MGWDGRRRRLIAPADCQEETANVAQRQVTRASHRRDEWLVPQRCLDERHDLTALLARRQFDPESNEPRRVQAELGSDDLGEAVPQEKCAHHRRCRKCHLKADQEHRCSTRSHCLAFDRAGARAARYTGQPSHLHCRNKTSDAGTRHRKSHRRRHRSPGHANGQGLRQPFRESARHIWR
jgi:hypothetical protein